MSDSQTIKSVRKLLDERRTTLSSKASGRSEASDISCTLYVQDVFRRDDFRLVAMPNVKYTEAMHGFLWPTRPRLFVIGGRPVRYADDASAATPSYRAPDLSGINASVRQLFRDFVHREEVASFAKFIHQNTRGHRDAVLFVNFKKPQRFKNNTRLKEELRKLFKEIVAYIPAVQDQLREEDHVWMAEAVRILSPDLSPTAPDLTAFGDPFEYYSGILRSTLTALGISEKCGIGTLHRVDAEKEQLTLIGKCGPIMYPRRAEGHSIRPGNGVVSWVATRGRPLLIPDLSRSDFKAVHVKLNNTVKSELAMPLTIGEDVVGVLCLESTKANAFKPHHLRSVWYAANRAAIVSRLAEQASLNRQLLDISATAAGGVAEAKAALTRLAQLAAHYLPASYCDIWGYDAKWQGFRLKGTNFENFDPDLPVRDGGLTEQIRRWDVPVLVRDIQSATVYSSYHWVQKQGRWVRGFPKAFASGTLNPETVKKGVRSELGVPISVGGRCIGVLWTKYRRDRAEAPGPLLMSRVLGFAAESGLVLDSIVRGTEVNTFGASVATEINSRWSKIDSSAAGLAVVTEPFQAILGGDLYARRKVAENSLGFLLVDGEGSGLQSTLRLLPLMAAFDACPQSDSAAHVLSHLYAVSDDVGARGTGVYCLIGEYQGRRWLSVASAGHESVMVFRKDSLNHWEYSFHPRDDRRNAAFGIPRIHPVMDDQIPLTIGDVVVAHTDGVAGVAEDVHPNRLAGSVIEVLKDKDVRTPGGIGQAVMEAARAGHQDGFNDDATVIVAVVK